MCIVLLYSVARSLSVSVVPLCDVFFVSQSHSILYVPLSSDAVAECGRSPAARCGCALEYSSAAGVSFSALRAQLTKVLSEAVKHVIRVTKNTCLSCKSVRVVVFRKGTLTAACVGCVLEYSSAAGVTSGTRILSEATHVLVPQRITCLSVMSLVIL
jgi:hypothetical protein